MEPLAGAAPAGSPYKGDLPAAAKRQRNRGSPPVLPRVLRFKRPLHHSLRLAARNRPPSRSPTGRKLVAIPNAALGRAGL